MKQELQKELKEKLQEGVKPSELRKLKRSKSTGDIPKAPSLPPNSLLQDQLKEKQREIEHLRAKGEDSAKQIENLRQQLESVRQELKATKQALDNSLEARVTAISTFGKEHQKRIKSQKELNQTLEEASEELITSDKTISSLRTKLFKAEQEHNRLKQELNNQNNLIPNSSYPDTYPNLDYLKYALYAFMTLYLTLLLTKLKTNNA